MTVRSEAPTSGAQSQQRRNSDLKRAAFAQALAESRVEVVERSDAAEVLRSEPRFVADWLGLLSASVKNDMEVLTTKHGLRPLAAVETLVVGVALFAFKVGRRYEQLLADGKKAERRGR